MCSTPKPKKIKQTKSHPNAMSMEMDQASYSRMIQQANTAFEKRHPESLKEERHVSKQKKEKTPLSSQSIKYWLTKATMSELKHTLSNYISVN